MAWNCHALPHRAPMKNRLLALNSNGNIRRGFCGLAGFASFNLPRKDFRHLLWLFRFMIGFSLHFTPFRAPSRNEYRSFPSRENPAAKNLLRQLQKCIGNSLWKLPVALSFALTVCLHAFPWEKPFSEQAKKKSDELFAAFIRHEWQHECGGGGGSGRRADECKCKQSVNSKEKPRKTEPICSDCPFLIRFAMINNKSL